MQYLGGMPYIDKVMDGTEKPERLTFQEAAEKAAADFRKAADLLPINWDNTVPGKNTLGKNQLRINKIMALGYLGKLICGLEVHLWSMVHRPVEPRLMTITKIIVKSS